MSLCDNQIIHRNTYMLFILIFNGSEFSHLSKNISFLLLSVEFVNTDPKG